MTFVWDEAKHQANLNKHRMDFVDAEKVFAGITLTFEDDRFDYSEQLFITIGQMGHEPKVLFVSGMILAIVRSKAVSHGAVNSLLPTALRLTIFTDKHLLHQLCCFTACA